MKDRWITIAAWSIAAVVVLGFVIVPLTLGYMGLGIIGILLAVPFFAWLAARFLMHGGGELWFAARDVMLAANMSPIPDAVLEHRAGECGRIGEKGPIGFSVAGVERFFAEHPGTEAGKLLLWIRREVVAPWERRQR